MRVCLVPGVCAIDCVYVYVCVCACKCVCACVRVLRGRPVGVPAAGLSVNLRLGAALRFLSGRTSWHMRTDTRTHARTQRGKKGGERGEGKKGGEGGERAIEREIDPNAISQKDVMNKELCVCACLHVKPRTCVCVCGVRARACVCLHVQTTNKA